LQHYSEVNQLHLFLNKEQDTSLTKITLNLRKSNYNLFLNFCQFKDLISMQNETFRQQMKQFDPEKLISQIVSEAKDIFEF